MSKKYETHRPTLPIELRRQTLIESGHRCAIIRCTEHDRLEIHHIDGNRENNVLPNLIPLCSIHHNDAEAEIIDREALRQYKEINRSLQGLEQKRKLSPTDVTLANAIRVVRKYIEQVSQADEKISPSSIIAVVKRTVRYGGGFYNKGEVVDCAKLYCTINGELLDRIDVSLQGYPEGGAKYVNLILAELRPEKREVRAIKASNAEEIAWSIRRAFDNIIVISSLDEAIQDVTELSRQVLIDGKATMRILSDIVDIMESRKSIMVDKGAMLAAAELSIVTARTVLGLSIFMHKDWYSSPRRWLTTKLKPVLNEFGEVDKSNAQQAVDKLSSLFLDFFETYCMYDY